MKKYFTLLLFVLTVIVAAGAIVSSKKVPIQKFIVKDSDGFAYFYNDPKYAEAKRGLNDYMMKILQSEGKVDENFVKLNSKLEEYSKTISRIMVVHTEQNIKQIKESKEINLFFIIDAENGFMEKIKKEIKDKNLKFAEVEKDYYKFELGKEVEKEIEKTTTDQAVTAAVSKTEIYITTYNDYVVMAFSLDKLKSYITKVEKEEQNKNFVEMYTSSAGKNIAFGACDIGNILKKSEIDIPKNEFVTELNIAKFYSSYDFTKKESSVTYEVSGKGKIFSMLDSSKLKERKLIKYASGNTVYFSNNSFKAMAEMIMEEARKNQTTSMYGAMADGMMGEPFSAFMDNIGDEILINIPEEEKNIGAGLGVVVVTNLKSEARMKKSLGLVGFTEVKKGVMQSRSGEIVEFKNGKMIMTFGKDEKVVLKEKKVEQEITKDTFLYFDIKGSILETVAPELKDAKIFMRMRASGNNIALDFKFDDETLKKLLEWVDAENKRMLEKKNAVSDYSDYNLDSDDAGLNNGYQNEELEATTDAAM